MKQWVFVVLNPGQVPPWHALSVLTEMTAPTNIRVNIREGSGFLMKEEDFEQWKKSDHVLLKELSPERVRVHRSTCGEEIDELLEKLVVAFRENGGVVHMRQ